MPQPRLKQRAAIAAGSQTVSAPAVGISELLGGWWVVDRNHDDMKHRGPYEHAETAGAVRSEMERAASERMNEYWNLAVVRINDKQCVDKGDGYWDCGPLEKCVKPQCSLCPHAKPPNAPDQRPSGERK